MNRTKWDSRYYELAGNIAGWSKDPSTKVGVVVTRPDGTIATVGFNGFPRGVEDLEERYNDRPTKYAMVVHAEANAIATAREPLSGYTLYCWQLLPCSTCAGLIIQSGITRVVCGQATPEQLERWGDSFKTTELMFGEAGVEITYL